MVNAALGTALVAAAPAPLGLRPPQLWSGLRLGLVAAAPVVIGVGASTAASPVRSAMAERDLPSQSWRWLAMRIPIGTVWSEEAAFRAALGTIAADAFGPTGGRVLQSLAFGLSHIADARSTGEPVISEPSSSLALRGGSSRCCASGPGACAAPMLAHLVINEAGAVAALLVQGASPPPPAAAAMTTTAITPTTTRPDALEEDDDGEHQPHECEERPRGRARVVES